MGAFISRVKDATEVQQYPYDTASSSDSSDDLVYRVGSDSDTDVDSSDDSIEGEPRSVNIDSDSSDDSIEYRPQYINVGTFAHPKLVPKRHTCLVKALLQADSSEPQISDVPSARVWSLWSPDANMTCAQRSDREDRRFIKSLSTIMRAIMESESDVFSDQVIQLKVKHSSVTVPFHKTILFGQSVVGDDLARVLTALSELDVPHGSIERFIDSTCYDTDCPSDVQNMVIKNDDSVLKSVLDLDCLFGALRIGQLISRHLTESQYGARWFTVLRWITTVLCSRIPNVCHIERESPQFPHAYRVMSDMVSFITMTRSSIHYSDAWEAQAYGLILQAIPMTCMGRLLVDTLSMDWLTTLANTRSAFDTVLFVHPLKVICYVHFEYNILRKMNKCFQQDLQLPSHSCHWQMAQTVPFNFSISINSTGDKSASSSAESDQTESGRVNDHVVLLHVHDWVMMQWPFFKRMFISQSEERRTRHLQLPCHFPVGVLEAVLSMCYRGGRDDLTSERAFIEEYADEFELNDLLLLNEVSPKPKPTGEQGWHAMNWQ